MQFVNRAVAAMRLHSGLSVTCHWRQRCFTWCMAMAGDTDFGILTTKALTNELQNKDVQFSGSIILKAFKYESMRVFFSLERRKEEKLGSEERVNTCRF